MTIQQPASPQPFKPARLLWLTFDFAQQLSTAPDTITPQIFIALMAHPAINQIKRFSANTENLAPDEIAEWEPGIFTVQVYRSSLVDVLTQVSAQLAPHLVTTDQTADQVAITVYTQMDGRHYPISTCLDENNIKATAANIEAMISQHESGLG